jgi:hypothetical protein
LGERVKFQSVTGCHSELFGNDSATDQIERGSGGFTESTQIFIQISADIRQIRVLF